MARSSAESVFLKVKPEMVVSAAASTVLGEQIAQLHSLVSAMGNGRDWDADSIHHLRVSARRLLVSLKVFSPFLKDRDLERFHKRIGKVRRRAGRVRDFDVLLHFLEESEGSLSEEAQKGLRKFSRWLKRERRREVPELQRAVAKLRKAEFWKWSEEHIAHGVPERNQLLWGQVAIPTLAKRLKEVLDAEPEALTGAQVPLHRLRIAFKGLRYSLEIFQGCFQNSYPASLQTSLIQMQDTLGAVSDIDSWVDLSRGFRKETSKKKRARAIENHFRSLLESQKQEALRVLDRDWSPDRRAPLLKNLVQVLPKPN